MAELAQSTVFHANGIAPPLPSSSGAISYVSRQAILDRRGQIFAYQLLFHQPSTCKGNARSDLATSSMSDALALFGVDRFTGGSPAFVPCTEDLLVSQLVAGLPPSLTVLEIPNDLEISARLLAACRELKHAGFRLALAGFQSHHVQHPLLELADFVKVASDNLEPAEWERLCRLLALTRVAIIAVNLQSQDAYRKVRALGIRYFQGFYFCNPDLIPNPRVPSNRLYHLGILRQLFRDPLDLAALCPLVMRDASLVYRVLRLANSPLCAVRQPVRSLESAIMILGDTAFRRIATLAIQCALNQGQPPEILRMALIRAHFCAHAASGCGLDFNEQYLLGMLSMLPAMLALPMETIVAELPVRPEIQQALLGIPGKERVLLSWIECVEANRVSESQALAAAHSLDEHRLVSLYMESLLSDASDSVLN